MTPGIPSNSAASNSEPRFCRTCRRALTRRTSPTGMDTFIHAIQLRGGNVDHPTSPAPVSEVPDPIIECDFCSHPEPQWVYQCADQHTDPRIVTSRTISAYDYRHRHRAARTLKTKTTAGTRQEWGQHWTACDGCAQFIERRDVYGLVTRVADSMPKKFTRGARLPRVRAELHANYTTVLATLAPGRGRVNSSHPLGIWDVPEQDSPTE
jgi:hypothetical protein